MGFDGRVAIVTGASSGIGRAAALAFARAGARVSLCDVNDEGGEETLEVVRAAGAEAIYLRCNVVDDREVGAMVAKTVEHFGRLDAAFNNAGIDHEPKPITEITPEVFDRVIAINVRGVYLCMRAEIPAMLKGGRGAIVNAASAAGLIGAPGISPYVASKHAVAGLTKTASAEFASSGVRVNAVCPGLVRTPMLERLEQNLGPEAFEAFVAMTPIRRIADPSEVANAVVWLCSDEASYVTGSAISIDGGLVSV